MITLQAGKKYYIEALQKEGSGSNHLSVQWQLPDATMETPLAGSHLSPYNNSNSSRQGVIYSNVSNVEAQVLNQGLSVFPNPVSTQVNVEFSLNKAGQTAILLYNLKGQLIRKYFSGLIQAGTKTRFVFGTESLESGIYTLNLINGENIMTKKIVIIK